MRRRSREADLAPYDPSPLLTLSPTSTEAIGAELMAIHGSATASAAWTANRLICVPFITGARITVDRFWWHNGITAADNTDVGIYDFAGTTKIASTGSTVNSGTSVLQQVDVTNFNLAANTRYWLVLGSDSSTHTYFRYNLVVSGLDLLGVKEQLSGWSSGLPSSLTFGAPTIAVLPLFGFARRLVA